MNVRSLGHLAIFIILLASLLSVGKADDRSASSGQKVPVVVWVTWDDAYKTPATNVYIEAYIEGHDFGVKYGSERSFVLKMVKAGQYEAALQPGIYDVFVSEGSSIPRCRRMLVKGNTPIWNLMLEHDDVYLNMMIEVPDLYPTAWINELRYGRVADARRDGGLAFKVERTHVSATAQHFRSMLFVIWPDDALPNFVTCFVP